jgi:transposase
MDLNMQKEYGYGKKEERLLYDKIGQRFHYKEPHRLTIMACIDDNNNYLAPLRFEGNTDTNVFTSYLRQVLIPELKKIKKHKLKQKEMKPKERLTVILDNAAFHKSKEINNLFEKNRINALYLPPYSPDLNPIEKKWAQLKAEFKKYVSPWILSVNSKKEKKENNKKEDNKSEIKSKIDLVDKLLTEEEKNVSMYF